MQLHNFLLPSETFAYILKGHSTTMTLYALIMQ